MRISVVVPSFNNSNNLTLNIPKVYKACLRSGLDFELIIPDDASSDDSVSVIEGFAKEWKNIKLLKSDEKINQGFSTNVNRGVNQAVNEIVVLLNTDVGPEEDFLAYLLPHFKDPDVFAVGCLEESREEGRLIKRGRGIGKWSKGFLVHSAGDLSKTDTLWVSGGAGAFRKDVWDRLKGLESLMDPFYWEDIDLSYRARKAGYKTLFELKSVVHHNHDTGVIKKKYSQTKINKVAYRNQFIFAWKNADSSNLLSNFIFLPYHLIAAFLRGDFSLIYGFFAAFLKLPKIIRSRSVAKKLWKLSDSEVVKTQ